MKVRRPLLLDLYCCAGGAAAGYHAAGFDVIGVDLEEQPRYPYLFVQADAIAFALRNGRHFDAIHASPPCQGHTNMSNRWRGQGGAADAHPKLIGPTREALVAIGRPWVIENVVGARREMRNPVTLTGGMFGLGTYRPRLFESSVSLVAPPPSPPPVRQVGVYGKACDGRLLWRRKDGTELRAVKSVEEASEAMGGVPWMTWREIAESIPPAYTEHIGRQLLRHVA